MQALRNCYSIQEAMPLVQKYGSAVKKLVEISMLLRSNPDPIQRQHGESFLNSAISAIQEMDANEQPTSPHGGFIKAKGEHFVKEELLPGGNQDGNAGSEQSTKTIGTVDVTTVSPENNTTLITASGENQWQEAFPPMGGQPQMGGYPPMMPGLDPSVAAEMGRGMPGLPQMNTNQMVRQMQYTVKKMMEAYVIPLRENILRHQAAIKSLSEQVQETKNGKSAMTLDMGKIAANATARPHIQETESNEMLGFQQTRIVKPTLEDTRHSMIEMDRLLTNKNQPYQ